MENKEVKLLINKIAKGDKQALKVFLNAFGGKIMSISFRILKDKPLCEDVLNEILIKIWNEAYKYKNLSNINGYIYTMAYNKAIDIKRKKKDVFFCNEENMENIQAESTDTDEKIFIDQILFKIEEPLRSILILKASHKLSFFEIAKIKNISYKSARNQYIKACNLFKALYEEDIKNNN